MSKLDRRDAVARLLENRGEALVVSGLGSATYDVMVAGDDDRNFYLWGAMGGAAMIGLGLALAQPERTVLVITGDGEQLMGLGGLATIAVAKPANLTIVVLNNEHYGETGMQPSHAGQGVDMVTVASGCGIADSRRITDQAGVDELSAQLNRHDGPAYAEIMVDTRENVRVLAPRDGVYVKNRFRKALGFDAI